MRQSTLRSFRALHKLLPVALWTVFYMLNMLSVAFGQVSWKLDSTENIGGFSTQVIGNPQVVQTPLGAALRFDGNDGLIVDTNPLAGAASFTMEMLLRPDTNESTTLDQPRILHIQSSSPNDHRAILEGRIDGEQWYLDGFLRAPSAANSSMISSLALIDEEKLHPADQWYSYAMVYDGEELRVYLNGELELSGPIAVLPLAAGQVSIGMRHNQVNFFSGDISQVRFTPAALSPEELLSARIPGDYNGDFLEFDGGIDAEDLTVWMAQFGSSGSFPQTGDNADGDNDGDVDGRDILFWQRHFNPSAPSSLIVPEPSTVITALWFLLGLAANRSKKVSDTFFTR